MFEISNMKRERHSAGIRPNGTEQNENTHMFREATSTSTPNETTKARVEELRSHNRQDAVRQHPETSGNARLTEKTGSSVEGIPGITSSTASLITPPVIILQWSETSIPSPQPQPSVPAKSLNQRILEYHSRRREIFAEEVTRRRVFTRKFQKILQLGHRSRLYKQFRRNVVSAIVTQDGDNRMFDKTEIDGIEMTALLDTGASRDVIMENYRATYNLKLKQIIETDIGKSCIPRQSLHSNCGQATLFMSKNETNSLLNATSMILEVLLSDQLQEHLDLGVTLTVINRDLGNSAILCIYKWTD
uniref:Peptidase A2 domain-containing protein n=1 Tax=Glossina brevipalpis TaxID=37001 RepID=A0A1A9W8G7_9MUSC